MKSFLKYLIVLSTLVIGCQSGTIEMRELVVVDYFDDSSNNIQLAKNLCYYDFLYVDPPPYEIARLLKNGYIKFDYVVQERNRVKIVIYYSQVEEFLKSEVINFFRAEMAVKLEKHLEHKEFLEKAKRTSSELVTSLDEKRYQVMWESSSSIMRSAINETEYLNAIKAREDLLAVGGERQFLHANYYETLPDVDAEEGCVVVFNFSQAPENFEQFVLINENEQPKLVRYDYYLNANQWQKSSRL
ncbi:MAG: DUF4019 domain-containing protein [Flavobacteriales bacterium]|nr:DUF4019 domain-containing protein [Flavobacteriales bacterium]